MKPIVLCAGKDGNAVIYGLVEKEPVPGEPVEMFDARMILYWTKIGLFGLCSKGPAEGTRITASVPRTVETVWQEWIEVTPEAREAIDGWQGE